MALQILAFDLLTTVEPNGTELCKKKCSSPSSDGPDSTSFPSDATDAQNVVTEQSLLTTAPWSECKLKKNGLFKLEKRCKTLQICYKSELAGKLATGTSKFGGRFRLGKRVNERPLSDCAGVVARKEWHALNVSKNSDRNFTIHLGLDGQFDSVYDIKPNDFIVAMNISKDFGPIEMDFLKALHLGAFMKDFDGMAFRILALDLFSSNRQNGTGFCKKTCAFEPTARNEDHFGISCTEIVFPAEVPQFVLNVSASPYEIGCGDYEKIYQPNETRPDDYYSNPNKSYAEACMEVPTSKCRKRAELYVCYKSSKKWPGKNFAELCQKHLGVDSTSNAAGFHVQICVHREGQFLVVESFINLSFSDEPSIRRGSSQLHWVQFWRSKNKYPFSSSNLETDRDKAQFERKPAVKTFPANDIGSVLNDIEQEKINGTRAKKLHFVPQPTDQMGVFFQIANLEFSTLITRTKKLKHMKPYEHNPNITWPRLPTHCEEYGDDCEEIRELLMRIENLESKRSESLICNFDSSCNKKSLHKEYIGAQRRCGLAPEEVPEDYKEWDKAITEATNLIICLTMKAFMALVLKTLFLMKLNMSVIAAHELLHALGIFHEFQQREARNYTILRGEDGTNEWQTENFGLAYDFGSVMHYPGLYDEYTGQYMLITLPRFYQETIGQEEGLSFKDTALINRIYCNDTCKKKDWCENGGYLNPNDCSKCLCPDGFAGTYCRLLELNLNCEGTSGTTREFVAERRIKVLKPTIKCGGAGPACRCYWKIKANGKKARIQLTYLNEMFECVDPCKNYVQINYRKDKRAQGARLCCPGALHDAVPNAYKNWIEAEEPNVDFIISTHMPTNFTKPTTLFELNYEAGAVKLTNARDCVHPENLFIKKRNPGTKLECVNKLDCLCHGETECLAQKKWFIVTWGCPVFVINGGQVRIIMPKKDVEAHGTSLAETLHCFRPEGASKSFWGYRENATADPIRVDEVQCLSYKAAGVIPKFKSLDDEYNQFYQSVQIINATVWVEEGKLDK
uniref:Metalloendopeptidase n=1 Tax=Globodera pallida TaxID=36090 RepID=A0A183C3N9_GLOPA